MIFIGKFIDETKKMKEEKEEEKRMKKSYERKSRFVYNLWQQVKETAHSKSTRYFIAINRLNEKKKHTNSTREMKYSICIRHHRKLAKRYMYSHHHICSKVRKKWPKLDSSYECVLCISCYIGNNFIVHIEIVCCTVKNRCLIFCFCLSVGLLVF